MYQTIIAKLSSSTVRAKSRLRDTITKISGFQKNLKIKISHHLDKQKMDKTRLILKIQDSKFTSKPNFYSRKNYFLASRSRDHFFRLKYDIFKKKILWVHLFRGPVWGVTNKNSIKFLFQHLLNLVLGKVKKFEGPSYHGS